MITPFTTTLLHYLYIAYTAPGNLVFTPHRTNNLLFNLNLLVGQRVWRGPIIIIYTSEGAKRECGAKEEDGEIIDQGASSRVET